MPAPEKVADASVHETGVIAARGGGTGLDRHGRETGGDAAGGTAARGVDTLAVETLAIETGVLDAGGVAGDGFASVADDEAVPDRAALVSAARLIGDADALLAGRDAPLGVRLGPDEEPAMLAPVLDRIALVELVMKTFRDGRAFTQARALREHLAYRGRIRVSGHVLPDQVQFLARCGVDAVVLPEGADVASFERAAPHFTVFYQPGVRDPGPVDRLRRRG